jgi:hypothetical protein
MIHTLSAQLDEIGHGTYVVSVTFDRFDGDRNQYIWRIAQSDGKVIAEGDDLRSGSGASVNHAETLASLCTFLSAYGEARRYGPQSDNYDLFPESVAEFAECYGEHLSIVAEELRPTE